MVFIYELAQTPWITFISMALALIGLILAVIFYCKGRKTKLIRYYLDGSSLFEDFVEKISGLSIQFSGKQIKTLTVTKIAFWNNGTETINHNDFPTNDPFSINIENGYEILDATMKSNNISNNVKINLLDNGKKINVGFEYLDPKDGFIIQIFHTGTKYSSTFKINGSIKGFGKIIDGKVSKNRFSKFASISSLVILGITIFISFLTNSNFVIIMPISLMIIWVLSFVMFRADKKGRKKML